MVGLVLVSHSRVLATAVRELVTSMTGSDLPVAIAAGTGPDRSELGTDATEILEAISAVMSEEGVLVLLDIGSAILSAETAVEFLDPTDRAKVRLCGAPFVEGAVAAGVLAGLGSSLAEVTGEAEKALRHKTEHLCATGDAESHAPVETARDDGSFLTATVVVKNPHGLHARPAAEFIRQAARYDCEILVRNLSNGKSPASARSMSELASLEILQGHQIELAARGTDAQEALVALRAAIEAGLGEELPPDGAARPEAEPPSVSRSEGTPVPVSGGIAIGPLFFGEPGNTAVPAHKINDTRKEKERLRKAIGTAKADLARDEMALRQTLGKDEAEIFRAQALVLEDPALLEAAERAIQEDHANAALAWQRSFQAAAEAYQSLSDDYMRQRAADVQDMGHRVLEALGIQRRKIPRPPQPGILVTEDLTPADVAGLPRESVLGVICLQGGRTSHAAILLRARGIPAIAKAKVAFDRASVGASSGETAAAAFDGESGELWLNPSATQLETVRNRKESLDQESARAASLSHEPAMTKDGHAIEVLANLGHAAEATEALKCGAEGVGLFRTEFLFLARDDVPGEEEQFEALSEVRKAMERRPVIIRTLDIGGDKAAPALGLPKEANPFLGVRAIRLCLDQRELFRVHLRAILRAAAGGNFRIMFPMIADPNELEEARSELGHAHASLEGENVPHPWPIPVGIMIEVPSAALLIDRLAPVVDFVSIGTNDLTQYVLAADRDNPGLAQFQDALHPAVLRLISQVITAVHQDRKPVGVCGEAASDPTAARLLVGLGVDELSLAPALIPKIKETIRSIDRREMQTMAVEAQRLNTAAEVRAMAVAKA